MSGKVANRAHVERRKEKDKFGRDDKLADAETKTGRSKMTNIFKTADKELRRNKVGADAKEKKCDLNE